MRKLLGTVLVVIVLAGPSLDAAAGEDLLGGYATVPDAELALQRGGFIQRDGLEMTFSIEELALVNGAPVYRRVLHDVCACGPADGSLNGTLFRMDSAGTSITHVPSGAWATVIQNSLNNQAISHFTLLDIAIGGVTVDRAVAQRMIDSGILDTLSGF